MIDPSSSGGVSYVEDVPSMRECDADLSDDTQSVYPCWKLVQDALRCPAVGQRIEVVRAPSERKKSLPAGTRLVVDCVSCVATDVSPAPGCGG